MANVERLCGQCRDPIPVGRVTQGLRQLFSPSLLPRRVKHVQKQRLVSPKGHPLLLAAHRVHERQPHAEAEGCRGECPVQQFIRVVRIPVEHWATALEGSFTKQSCVLDDEERASTVAVDEAGDVLGREPDDGAEPCDLGFQVAAHAGGSVGGHGRKPATGNAILKIG
jgi:hypothetical protein